MRNNYKMRPESYFPDCDLALMLMSPFIIAGLIVIIFLGSSRKPDSSLNRHESVEIVKMAEYIRDNGSIDDKKQLVEIVNRIEKTAYVTYSDKQMIEVVYRLSKKYVQSETSSTEDKKLIQTLLEIQGSN